VPEKEGFVKINVFQLGCCFSVLALAAGCQSPNGQAGEKSEIPMAHVQASSQKVLADILAKAGIAETDLVLEDTIAFPPPAVGDKKNPRSAWMGRFAGQEKAVINAEDQMLVIAKTIPCNAAETRYVFNPFLRTWILTADRSSPEGNLLWVLFNGKAKDFVTEVDKAQNAHELLGSLVRTPQPVTGATFPVQVLVDEMRNDLIELGLRGLDEHLRTVHADGQPCNPDVHLYVKPAAGK
jgi:hypothetical protein